MKRFMIDGQLVLGVGTALLLAGCATPNYQVTDPHSGNTYYTQKVDNVSGGGVKLEDARTGNTVTIQNSEVKEISSEAYKAGLAAPAKPAEATAPPAAAAPAPAATPTTAPTAAPAAAPATAPAPAHNTKP